MSSPLAPAGMVGWCMCRAQLIPAVMSSKRAQTFPPCDGGKQLRQRFVMGKNTGSSWFTTELISASQPQILGNPDLDSSRTGRLGDDIVAVIRLSFIVAVLALTFNSDLRWRSLGAGERIHYNRASACGHLVAEFLQFNAWAFSGSQKTKFQFVDTSYSAKEHCVLPWRFRSFVMEKRLSKQDIIVIGASAGGLAALKKLVAQLPSEYLSRMSRRSSAIERRKPYLLPLPYRARIFPEFSSGGSDEICQRSTLECAPRD